MQYVFCYLFLTHIHLPTCRALDILQSASYIHTVYYYLIIHFGDYQGIGKLIWSFKVFAALVCTNVSLVQVRIHLSRHATSATDRG